MNIPDFLDPAVPTIMRQLKQAGYVTALYGKWHMTTYDPPGGMPEPDVYGVDEYQIAERRTRRPENYLWSDHPCGRNHIIDCNEYIFDDGTGSRIVMPAR